MSLQNKRFYEFADFRLDLSEKILFQADKPVPLTPKVFDTLRILLENAGRLLEKDFLIGQIWPDRYVDESNLTYNIKMLRKALGDSAANPLFIETVPKRGYRFIAEIRESSETDSSAADRPADLPEKKSRPYFMLSISVLALIGLFGIAFVWFGENSPAASDPSGTVRLTKGGKITNASVTPDGKHIVFALREGVGESLQLQRIDTGSITPIVPPQRVNFVGLTVSPDGNYAYYSVFSDNSAVLILTRVSLYGGAPETLSEIATDASVSFSPDGRRFAYTESHSSVKETYLKTAAADGTDQKVLITTRGENRMFPIFRASPVAWSPDGETIAAVVQETDGQGTFCKILLVEPDGGSEKSLSDRRWNSVEHIVWKDSETLALIESEDDLSAENIWQISRKTGAARKLTDNANEYEWLSSAGGKLFAVRKEFFSHIQVADHAENTKTFQPKQILGEPGRISAVAWSKDGKIFYNSRASGKSELWRINSDGTAPHRLTNGSHLFTSFDVSPVDNSFVFQTRRAGRIFLSTADSEGRNIRRLTDGTPDTSPGFSADGKTVIFQRGTVAPTLWKIDAEAGGLPAEQMTGYFALNPAVSPDGRKLVYHFMDYGGKKPNWKLGVIDSRNRRLLNKLEFPFPVTKRRTVWHPNNDWLTMVFENGESQGILLLSATDGKFQTIDDITGAEITSFDWSPDGRRFVFSQEFETSDAVLLGGF